MVTWGAPLKEQLVMVRRLRRLLQESEARVQFLVDNWPGKLEDGGITFPDGEFYPKSEER